MSDIDILNREILKTQQMKMRSIVKEKEIEENFYFLEPDDYYNPTVTFQDKFSNS